MNLQVDYLIGKLEIPAGKDFYFVGDLVSPENGLPVERVMLDGIPSATTKAFGPNVLKLKGEKYQGRKPHPFQI